MGWRQQGCLPEVAVHIFAPEGARVDSQSPLAWLWFSTHVVDEVAGRGVGTHLGSGAICDLLTSGVIFGGVFVAIVAFIVMASSWTCEEEAGGDVAGISLPAMGGIEAKGALL